MEQKWIDQFNEKCLNFLNRKLEEMQFSYIEERTNIECYREMTIQDLKFHSDWNWIMEVVEKIETLDFEVSITFGASHIWTKNSFNCITNNSKGENFDKKRSIIQAIDQFIDWFNIQQIS